MFVYSVRNPFLNGCYLILCKRRCILPHEMYITGVFVVETFPTPNLDTLEVSWGQSAFLERISSWRAPPLKLDPGLCCVMAGMKGMEEQVSAACPQPGPEALQLLPVLCLVAVLWLSPLATQRAAHTCTSCPRTFIRCV